MMRSIKEKFSTIESLIRLWRHEVLCVIHDKLINLEEREIFNKLVTTLISESFAE